MQKKLSYKSSGVNISVADATKKTFAKSLKTDNPLVLNTMGAFASLVDGRFPEYKHPILVCKTEEPGSKQKIAFQHKRIDGICDDMINHLINDVAVMGAKPLFVQDLIVCGKLEKAVVTKLVANIAKACKAQGCVLTGGETSEQPSVIEPGTYVLGSSCIGVVEKSNIIDGSAIKPGDLVLAIASSGIHTNGYTLVRALIKKYPTILRTRVGKETFLDAILTPHRCYYQHIKGLFENKGLHGMAHITGGGIPGNLNRILPKGMNAVVDASAIRLLPIFRFIKEKSGNDDADMIQTFNLGVGLILIVDPSEAASVMQHVQHQKVDCYPIGEIVAKGKQQVRMKNKLQW